MSSTRDTLIETAARLFHEQGYAATEVTLTHLGFGPEKHWDETYDYFGKAWTHVLGQFKKHLESAEG